MPEETHKTDAQTDLKPDPDEVTDESDTEEEEHMSQKRSSSDSESDDDPVEYVRPGDPEIDLDDEENNAPQANIQRFMRVLNSKRLKRAEQEEEDEIEYHEDLFDFPRDKENWKEDDLKELWADAPLEMTKPGWDPNWVDEEEVEIISDMIREGKDPPIAPFYVPYRKHYPAIPDNHYDISSAKSVIEELDRVEEFLTWVSYIFQDGSSYEGTVWDDLAHGKGVYIAEEGLVRYEGEWLQNNMEGHGVVEVDIPTMQPVPGSKLEAKMRAEGKIIKRDFMDPEDKKWLEMDIEDTVRLVDGNYEIPFYESEEWVRQFGRKPEKGRYRYAGQWKHGRMHGCGVYEVNERVIYGRFYFGELLQNEYGCDADISAMHAGIAEVAAAKARMFMYKPDGMVREERGPYDDPQHPYFYEEDEVWMAPGFINQFYEVPDFWKTYVHEVDQERELWLNSFYKAPLRLPMPAELEYWWEKDREPEFVLLNKEPEPDPNDPSKLVYTEDPLILHTPTGRIINYIDDEEHGIRLFWQPAVKEGEDVYPEKVQFLPLGFDEFYGREASVEKENFFVRVLSSIDNAFKLMFERLEKWALDKKKENNAKFELLKAEIELLDAEMSLKEAIEEVDKELEIMQKEEEKKAEMGLADEEDIVSSEPTDELGKSEPKEAEDEEEEEEEEEAVSSSFGSVGGQDSASNEQKGKQNGKPPFAASSLSFTACSLASAVPLRLQQSFAKWKEGKLNTHMPSHSSLPMNGFVRWPIEGHASTCVSFPQAIRKNLSLKARVQKHKEPLPIPKFYRKNCSKQNFIPLVQTKREELSCNVLSLQMAIQIQ